MSAKIRSLSLDKKVLLAAFLKVLPNNKAKFSYQELLESNISPARYLNADIFIELACAKLIGKEGGVFSSQDGCTVFNIILKGDYSEQQLADLRSQISSADEHSELDVRGVVMLMINVIVAECIQFVSDQLSLDIFDIKLLKNPPKALLNLLERYTLAEIYTLISEAASESPLLDKEQSVLGVLSEICHSAQRLALLDAKNNKPINLYQKKEHLQSSVVTSILMESYLGFKSDEYFTSHIWPLLSSLR